MEYNIIHVRMRGTSAGQGVRPQALCGNARKGKQRMQSKERKGMQKTANERKERNGKERRERIVTDCNEEECNGME